MTEDRTAQGATDPALAQGEHRVRLEWGPVGAAAITDGADIAVVVDVLSFTTTLCVAAERGIDVLPYGGDPQDAEAYAADHDAVLALGRAEARDRVAAAGRYDRPPLSLSPAHMASAAPVPRVVLPSPNGSALCFDFAGRGLIVVGACLRNRHAVARWLQAHLAEGSTVALVAAGERWSDGSLRPGMEDQWGAGGVLEALVDLGVRDISAEGWAAVEAFRAVESRLPERVAALASARELATKGFADDVAVAARIDVSTAVPVLDGVAFSHE